MTAPRRVLPGTTWLVSRRCSERRYFLTPSALANDIFLYVLAVTAARYRILVHVVCVMSNHYHLLVTDPDAQLPEFMRDLDSLVARAMNAALGRWEGFWASDSSYSAVAHGAVDDVVGKAVYVLANPVTAGLVPRGSDWPGLWTAPEDLGSATLTVARPRCFFRENGDMPASAELVLSVPPGFASAEEFRERVGTALRAEEGKTRREFQAERRSFVGRARVLAQKVFGRPTAPAPRRVLNPHVAGRDVETRVGMLEELTKFRRDYRDALRAFRAGLRDVLFPAGTYLLRVQHRVRCAVLAATPS